MATAEIDPPYRPPAQLQVEIYSVENGYVIRPTRSIFNRKRSEESIQSDRIWIAPDIAHLKVLIAQLCVHGSDPEWEEEQRRRAAAAK